MILSDKAKVILFKRFHSFLWRFAMLSAVAIVEFGLENIGLLNLSPQAVVFIGLILGEVSKFLNSNLKELRAK